MKTKNIHKDGLRSSANSLLCFAAFAFVLALTGANIANAQTTVKASEPGWPERIESQTVPLSDTTPTANPQSATMVPTNANTVTATGGIAEITEVKIKLIQPSSFSSVYLFNGTTLIATTPTSGQYATFNTSTDPNRFLANGQSCTYLVRTDLYGYAPLTGGSPGVSFVHFKFKDSSGATSIAPGVQSLNGPLLFPRYDGAVFKLVGTPTFGFVENSSVTTANVSFVFDVKAFNANIDVPNPQDYEIVLIDLRGKEEIPASQVTVGATPYSTIIDGSTSRITLTATFSTTAYGPIDRSQRYIARVSKVGYRYTNQEGSQQVSQSWGLEQAVTAITNMIPDVYGKMNIVGNQFVLNPDPNGSNSFIMMAILPPYAEVAAERSGDLSQWQPATTPGFERITQVASGNILGRVVISEDRANGRGYFRLKKL